eukprot:CAMPEP_0171106112 /NCGR_PEP_ID=MMETSP0766_2-20121228/64083_1 /TAXON_ID=439317 /ORGANISM="Gambierdiscus australes, Strain CAWD 149" /LENGTH=173 /DNA_ID=CAMNT_0011567121 /DNA_START=37 /DNA_END=558 /DNA_ORIENTATION=-
MTEGDPLFVPIKPHPSQIVHRENVAILLQDGLVVQPKPLVRLLQDWLPEPEKRFILVCEAFEQLLLEELLDALGGMLNLVIVECPGFGKGDKETLHGLAALTKARILSQELSGADEAGAKLEESPFGLAETVDVPEDNIVTFRVGEGSVVIKDANEVMVVHTREDEGEPDDSW